MLILIIYFKFLKEKAEIIKIIIMKIISLLLWKKTEIIKSAEPKNVLIIVPIEGELKVVIKSKSIYSK